VIPQPWFPLLSYIRDRERATPFPSAPLGGPAVAAVVCQEGRVQDWGLFSASDLSAQVLVQCSTSPSGYGSRCLTSLELGGLWDVPISVLDLLPSHEADTLLRGLCRSAPAKILFGGADFLLTASFRGGLGGMIRPKFVPGPHPLPNLALGLTSGDSTLDPDSEAVMAVLKGERQKADNAIVPDQLWLQAFAGGYADPECWARHHLALGSSGAAAERGRPENPPQNWRTSLEGFQTFGLCFWRRRLLGGYFKWRRTNLPWQSNLPTPGQMVRCRMTMIFGGVNAAYEWMAKGRVSYNKQWALLRCSEEGQATVEAGLDAIRRVANASWFEWLEGSAPLFWN
jgi:hypothetical protein